TTTGSPPSKNSSLRRTWWAGTSSRLASTSGTSPRARRPTASRSHFPAAPPDSGAVTSEVLLPGLPVVGVPVLRDAPRVSVGGVCVDHGEPGASLAAGEGQDEHGIEIGALPVRASPRLHDQFPGNERQERARDVGRHLHAAALPGLDLRLAPATAGGRVLAR